MQINTATSVGQVESWAIALLGDAIGSTTMGQIQSDIAAYAGLNNTFNTYYNELFASVPTATVAATMAANLGIVAGTNGLNQANVDAAVAYITGSLNGAVSTGGVGLEVHNLLNLWAGMTADPIYGAAATAYNTTVQNVVGYEQTHAPDTSAAAASAAAVASGASVLLTTGTDIVTGTNFLGSETYYNVDGKGPTLNAGDILTGTAAPAGGVANNTLTITDLTPNVQNGNLPSGVTLNNIQNIVLNSSNNTAPSGFSTVGVAGVKNLTITTAGQFSDLAQADQTTNVTMNHNSVLAGAATALGGNNVTVTQNSGAVYVGLIEGTVPLPSSVATGAIQVTSNSTGTTVANPDNDVQVVGGSSVSITTTSASFNGAVEVGNTAGNTGNSAAGGLTNTSGQITVNNAGTSSSTTVYGGGAAGVTVNAAGGAVTVGDPTARVASNNTTGTVQITDAAQTAFDGVTGLTLAQQQNDALFPGYTSVALTGHNVTPENVDVSGGSTVNVTTNAGGVTVGSANNPLIAGTEPTGAVTVVDTANQLGTVYTNSTAVNNYNQVSVYGGTDVSVTAANADVTVGSGLSGEDPTGAVSVTESAATTLSMNGENISVQGGNGVTVSAQGQNVSVGNISPTSGAQVVTQNGVLTGAGMGADQGTVVVDGGSTVNVTTTGGSVSVGAVVGATNAVPTGAVSITDNFGSGNATADQISVLGGTTVNINVASADSNTISVGAAATLNSSGTGLSNSALEPTGNVTIANGTVANPGTGGVNVYTNGATSVSITGGSALNVVDVQSTLATGGANAGKAVGTSTLSSVTLDNMQTGGPITVQSDALTGLSVLDNGVNNNAITVTNNTAGHALTLTLGNDNNTVNPNGSINAIGLSVTDATATGVTVTGTTASSSTVTLSAAKAATLTATNAAATTLNLAGDNALTTITATNKGALNLGDVSGLAKLATINATASTGAVTVSNLNTSTTSFNGAAGTGNMTVGINSNTLATGVSIVGGSGSNTLIANYNALTTDTALGNNASIKGFSTLQLGNNVNSAAVLAAVQQVDTITFTAPVSATGTGTLVESIGSVGVAITTTDGETTVQLAAQLENAVATNANLIAAGYTVQYTVGNAFFTVTGPAAGTSFTDSVVNAGSTGDTFTVSQAAGHTAVSSAYDATGFSTLSVGATSGVVTFDNVGAGVTLDVTATPGNNINYLLANSAGSNDTLALTVGVDGTPIALGGTGTGAITTTVLTTGIENVNIASKGSVTDALGRTQTNTVTIGDTGANAVTITGDQALTLNLHTDANAAFSKVAQVDTISVVGAATATGNLVLSINGTASGNIGITNGQSAATIASNIDAALIALAPLGVTVAPYVANATTVTVTGTVAGTAIVDFVSSNASTGDTVSVATTTANSVLGSSNVTSISAAGSTGAVNVTGVALNAAGTDTITGGTGTLTAQGGGADTNVDTITTGSGGGVITLGAGGDWVQTGSNFGNYSSGSESIDLTASASASDTLKVNNGSISTYNGSAGGVTGFVLGVNNADQLSYTNAQLGNAPAGGTKTIVANTAAVTPVNSLADFANAANVLNGGALTGTLQSVLANLDYTVSNGVITFQATGGHQLADFTSGQLVSAAEIVVNTAGSQIAAFSTGGNTYVVANDGAATLATGSGKNLDSVVELKGVSSVAGFGTTGAANTVDVTNVTTLVSNSANTGTAAAQVYDDTGFAQDSLGIGGRVALNSLTAGVNSNSYTFDNLAASAILTVNSGNLGGTPHVGSITTTQMGVSGGNSLTVNIGAVGDVTFIDSLTVTGDGALVLNGLGGLDSITSLVDATNTLSSISITGSGVDVGGMTDTALTKIDVSGATGYVAIGDTTALSQAGLTISGVSSGAVDTSYVKIGNFNGAIPVAGVTGNNDVITLGTVATNNNASNEIAASGSGTHISIDGTGNNTIYAIGASDVITLGDAANGIGANTITATGTGDTLNLVGLGGSTATVGNNATINFTGQTASGGASSVGTITITGDTAVTLNHVTDFIGQALVLNNTTTEVMAGGVGGTSSMVNVASATTLTQAENLAVSMAVLDSSVVGPLTAAGASHTAGNAAYGTLAANTGVVDWFQFGGNTYVVEAVNNTGAPATHATLGASDVVVTITGNVNLTHLGITGGHTLHL